MSAGQDKRQAILMAIRSLIESKKEEWDNYHFALIVADRDPKTDHVVNIYSATAYITMGNCCFMNAVGAILDSMPEEEPDAPLQSQRAH